VSDSVVIRTNALSKSYDGLLALKSLDITIGKNTIIGFLGPNGAGKTTTIKLLLGLVRPSSGGGTVFGLDMVKDSIEIRKRTGYLAQDPSFYEFMTPREMLRFVSGFHFTGPQSLIDKRIEESLEIVGLTSHMDRSIKGFSVGEKQRLGISQAYVNSPDLLILDEPAASLDPMGRRDVLELLRELRKHTTILYSTHILDDVQRVSDMVAILNRGELIAYSPIQQMLSASGETIFSMTTKGDHVEAHANIKSQPWVSSINLNHGEGQTDWEIGILDEKAAETNLLRIVISVDGLIVTEFGRKKFELEEIFMNLLSEQSFG
jgi:ABC-2 type transport system ATP-binding protein